MNSVTLPVNRLPQILIGSQKDTRQDPGKTGERPGNLPGKPGFFLHLIRVSGGFGFSAINLQGKPRVFSASYQGFRGFRVFSGKLTRKTQSFSCILSRFQWDIGFPTEKLGKNGSYQGLRGKKLSKKTWKSSDRSGISEKESSLELLFVPILLYSVTIWCHNSIPNQCSLHKTFLHWQKGIT